MIDDDRISDFGEARDVGNIEQTMTMTTGVGTPFYMAPELLQGQTHYTKAVDVYSYGVMSSQVYTGSLKYDGVSFDNIYCLFPFLFCFTFPSFFFFICFDDEPLHSICDTSV